MYIILNVIELKNGNVPAGILYRECSYESATYLKTPILDNKNKTK